MTAGMHDAAGMCGAAGLTTLLPHAAWLHACLMPPRLSGLFVWLCDFLGCYCQHSCDTDNCLMLVPAARGEITAWDDSVGVCWWELSWLGGWVVTEIELI
jgi:hypothetical protein